MVRTAVATRRPGTMTVGRPGRHEDRVTEQGDQPMTSPVEGRVPERPDLASERPLSEPDAPPREEPEEPADPAADERGLDEIVKRDHPLS